MSKKFQFSRMLCSGLFVLISSGAAMANNVQVAIEGSLLTVFGDNLGNSVLVEETVDGIVITGRAGTTVNGLPSVTFPGAVLNAAEIRMEGGNDTVMLSGLAIANDLYVSLGEGNDVLENSSAFMVGANMTVEAGAGTDRVSPNNAMVFQDMFVDGGLGGLQASITNSTLEKSLTLISDEAADSVSVSNTAIAEFLLIESKGGNDTVSVTAVNAFGLMVSSDAGADSVTLSGVSTMEDVGVFTGVGNDIVSMTSVGSGKAITVSVDGGNDSVTATSVTATYDAVFEGGAGRDTIIDKGIFGGTKKDIKEFEIRR